MNRRERLEALLRKALSPSHLEVEDESRMHAGGPHAQSHFRVVVVSEAFAGDSPVARHRKVHAAAAEEFAGGMHALSIQAFTPREWAERTQAPLPSPPCRGGDGGAG